MRSGGWWLMVFGLLAVGCTSAPAAVRGSIPSTGGSSTASVGAVSTATVGAVSTPAVGASSTATSMPVFQFPLTSTTCGANGLIIGSDATHWTPVADCMGQVGNKPLPVWILKVGQPAFVASDEGPLTKIRLTSAPSGIVSVHGVTIIAKRKGTAIITVSGLACAPDEAAQIQPHICPLVEIDVV